MAAHDTHATGTYASGSTFSWNHTIATGGKLAIGIGYKFAALETITAVTVGGSTATFDVGVQNAGGGNRLEYWKHNSPSTGVQLVHVTFNGNLGGDGGLAGGISVSATSASGMSTGTTAGPTSSTSPAVTVANVGGSDVPYGFVMSGGDPTELDTAIAELILDSGTFLNAERQAAGGDGVMNWSQPSAIDEWLVIGLRAIDSGGGGGGGTSKRPNQITTMGVA